MTQQATIKACELDKLGEYLLLCKPYFRRWRGIYRLPRHLAKVTVDGRPVSASTTPSVCVLTQKFPVNENGDPWVNVFTSVWTVLRNELKQASKPFPLGGLRCVPLVREKTVFHAVCLAKTKLRGYIQKFVEAWPASRRQIRKHVGKEIFQYLEPKLPQDLDALRAQFELGVRLVYLAPTRDHVDSLHRRVSRELLSTCWLPVHCQCTGMVRDGIDKLLSGPREELASALNRFTKLHAENAEASKRIRRLLRQTADLLYLFNPIADRQLCEEMLRTKELCAKAERSQDATDDDDDDEEQDAPICVRDLLVDAQGAADKEAVGDGGRLVQI